MATTQKTPTTSGRPTDSSIVGISIWESLATGFAYKRSSEKRRQISSEGSPVSSGCTEENRLNFAYATPTGERKKGRKSVRTEHKNKNQQPPKQGGEGFEGNRLSSNQLQTDTVLRCESQQETIVSRCGQVEESPPQS
ncbi:hypothetical protein ZHAS_00010633 [Anopheles sinensis]|uniref:Uncharacterized protein n=1 Tax=Anopheles sinensis TaxID=74873 RepID=A0A084VY34_ANOSI|nr:hypothetical protein ZHAS_00010633 [Anopheles sinensis]